MKRSGSLLRGLFTGAAIAQIARRGQLALVAVATLASSACYTYSAVPTSQPLVERNAEFRITDMGRVELARQLGPGVLTVEGKVVRQDETGWTLRVYRVIDLRDQSTTWSGEEVELPRTSVELVSRRDFDRARSVIATAAVAGGITLFVISRSLLGGGSSPEEGGGGNTGAAIRF
jgi:hypothetical protein